ncbi:MAG: stage V sporulation protein AD [Alicyclobacillus macrosporangiidus]|uniref:stage V sporulation protein AD n=1 Tax=Alicyclobacillus macrosporangiidus TaxID=392015 RepID=UPI0026F2EFD5|nr:stage V sporulation protein AD [Alicyclobacillus macrosporangiidus]MCL6597990.1 stage V sporulation protein AD [Alicyclobacillus macrosporangiidus]
MPKIGQQTWLFPSEPRIEQVATVAGKLEGEGPLGACFDVRKEDDWCGADTWEHAEQGLFREVVQILFQKAGITPQDVDLFFGSDLNAQVTSFHYGTREFDIPKIGLYSACASSTAAMALAAASVEAGFAQRVLAGTSSHTSTAERQFRFPTEYGAQKPPTAQRTVTGAGAALIGTRGRVAITAATIGRVVDYGVTSPWEYGAAMAPAAASTILSHLRDTGRKIYEFDAIATGDLGRVGHAILRDLLEQQGVEPGDRLLDCGMLIYAPDQPEVFAGGSGAACSSLVMFGHFVKKLESGEWKRILVAATGALLSLVSSQQQDTIPAVSHAVVLERKDG